MFVHNCYFEYFPCKVRLKMHEQMSKPTLYFVKLHNNKGQLQHFCILIHYFLASMLGQGENNTLFCHKVTNYHTKLSFYLNPLKNEVRHLILLWKSQELGMSNPFVVFIQNTQNGTSTLLNRQSPWLIDNFFQSPKLCSIGLSKEQTNR